MPNGNKLEHRWISSLDWTKIATKILPDYPEIKQVDFTGYHSLCSASPASQCQQTQTWAQHRDGIRLRYFSNHC
jgi:hypothetical protein